MEYILQSLAPLQQDLAFLPRVSACHRASLRLQGEIVRCSEELEHQKPLLLDYRFVADLATAFYQALQQVALLSPLYLFTLHNFLLALRHTLLLKGQPIVSCNSEGSVMTKVTNRIVLQLMAQYRPCLFQSHASLLRLLLSVALFGHSEGGAEEEREAFLCGLSDPLQFTPDNAPSVKLPSWIPSSVHAELVQLEKIAPFCGLIESLAANSGQWQEYLSFPSSTVIGPIPCQSHSHLSIMQRALLWKTLSPSWHSCVAAEAWWGGAPWLGLGLDAAFRQLQEQLQPLSHTLRTQSVCPQRLVWGQLRHQPDSGKALRGFVAKSIR